MSQRPRSLVDSRALFFALFAAGCGVAALPSRSPGAETITDTQLNFTLVVPDGFQRLPAVGDNVYILSTSDPSLGLPDAIMSIQRLHGTIGRSRPILPKDAPPDMRQYRLRWKGFDVEASASHITKEGVTVAARTVQIPLRDEAIQINLVTPGEKEQNADAFLAQFLAGLNGPSNWQPADYSEQLSPTEIASLFAIVCFWVIIIRRKRASNKVLGARHRLALKVGFGTTVVTFIAIVVVVMLLTSEADDGPLTPEQRGYKLAVGTTLLSGWLGLIAYGFTRLFVRLRSGPPRVEPKPLPPVPTPDFSGLGGNDTAARLENIYDDSPETERGRS